MTYVLELGAADRSRIALVGGKAAHLGELSRVEGVRVPDGFCVTTEAYRQVAALASIDEGIARLARLRPDDREGIRAACAALRAAIDAVAVPDDLTAAIVGALGASADEAWAVRSSATAEDLPAASFAGQQDTYLDVVGAAAVVAHVRRCWASLFTERAVVYRLRNGFDHREVHMAVLVQRMVPAEASGVLFTADPVTGHRKISAVEATLGLGEALVSGHVNADTFRVRDGRVVDRSIARQGDRRDPALTDAQAVRLAALGRRIEAHFGCPQDIEWCRVGEDFHVVQSRPITTLFPVPAVDDEGPHVYLSVGHQQMMTDPMRPLGISLWQLTAGRPMLEAGGRLFVDVTRALASPAGRAGLLGLAGRSDPLTGDALRTLIDRGYVPTVPDEPPAAPPPSPAAPSEPDPAVVPQLIARTRASIETLEQEIRTKSGAPLLDFIRADIEELRRHLFDPEAHRVIMAAVEATWWLNEHMEAWLGEKNAADVLTRSVPHNVTSQMGLALLDVADVIRAHPEVVAFLRRVDHDGFLDQLPALPGGRAARDALEAWLDAYGVRCAGEIDITRPRWRERPTALLPILLGHVDHAEPGAGARRFARGLEQARQKEEELLARLSALPDGEAKAREAERRIARVRAFIGFREFPKYGMVSRYFVYKRALMEEAGRLTQAQILRAPDDVFWLTFQELQEVVRTRRVDHARIRRREEAFRSYRALTPPRVLTSDGEAVTGSYRRDDVPEGALVGLAVSAGTVEGRARVVRDLADADLEPGDILVTAYTDPSWTPLFVGVAGLITEVGGLMTHGAVIAREYGLPAVVGVERATRRIRDGQRIRLHGADGLVELLA